VRSHLPGGFKRCLNYDKGRHHFSESFCAVYRFAALGLIRIFPRKKNIDLAHRDMVRYASQDSTRLYISSDREIAFRIVTGRVTA
jgi:hypothetical protein